MKTRSEIKKNKYIAVVAYNFQNNTTGFLILSLDFSK